MLLFARLEPSGVAWLRIASAALVFALWRRPWRVWPGWIARPSALLACWGAVLAIMNVCFYLAIEALPLGTVAAIEFLPVIVLAAARQRGPRATGGPGPGSRRGLPAHRRPAVGRAGGLLLAAANAVLFAMYVVLGHRVSRDQALTGIDGLALAMLDRRRGRASLRHPPRSARLHRPDLLAAAIGVGICSSVVPYVADQLAMRRLTRATYSLMVALLPATATVIGVVVLAQVPAPVEVVGVLLVVAGVVIHREHHHRNEES